MNRLVDEINKPIWIRNKVWDFLFFQSAYWIFPLAFTIFYLFGRQTFLLYGAIAFIVTRLMHTYFSMYLCIGHPAYRKIAREDKVSFYYIPLAIIATITLFFILPFSIFPLEAAERFKLYAFLFFPLTYWHYALQHYGIISIYRSRANQRLSQKELRLEKFYCHISTSILITFLTLKNFYDVSFAQLSFSNIFWVRSVDWNLITILILVPLPLYMSFIELKRSNRSITKLLYIWSMGLMPVVLIFDSFFISWALLDMQHFFVVFGLSGHILSNYEVKNKNIEKNKSLALLSIKLIVISILISIIYYFFSAHGVKNKHYGLVLDGLIPKGETGNAQLFFYGLFIAIGICHYYYDRLAFRFSDKKIGPIIRDIIK